MNVDLTIAYRVYPGVSKKPVAFSKDKLALTELGIASLKRSCGRLKLNVIALLDGCPDVYEEILRKYFSNDLLSIQRLDRVGNGATFLMQIEELTRSSATEWVYFAEDDYFYREGEIESALLWMKSQADVEYVTPYDHLDLYTHPLHRYQSWIRASKGRHWRNISATCLTFFARKKALMRDRKVFSTFSRGNPDASVWLILTKLRIFRLDVILGSLFRSWDEFTLYARAWLMGWARILFGPRVHLWSPMPSLGTHLESTCLAPDGDWKKEIQEFAKKYPGKYYGRGDQIDG